MSTIPQRSVAATCAPMLVALALVLAATAWHPRAQQPPVAPTAEGVWEGNISTPAIALRVVVRLERKTDDTWSGSIDIPAQAAAGLRLSPLTVRGRTVSMTIAGVPGMATFDGELAADGGAIVGTFSQGGGSVPFRLVRQTAEQVAAAARPLRRPQLPTPPFPYRDEQVTYQNAKGGVTLAGTLTLPATPGPHPAVVLITGSGAEDRDETVFGHKPFLVLADYLTRRGIAVLRSDDRGVGGSTGNVNTSTSDDFAEDSLAGVALLKARKDIDPRRIGLIGHSEGGLIAPLAATRSSDVAFIVLMAGPGLTGEQILYLQAEVIARGSGASDGAIAANRAVQERIFTVLKTDSDNASAVAKINAFAPGQGARVANPWFRYFLTYDPAPALRRVSCPVLAINGERDLQVPYRENLSAIGEALKAGGNRDASTVSLPGLNHLFQTSQTGLPAEYVTIEETMAPAALDAIGVWIARVVR